MIGRAPNFSTLTEVLALVACVGVSLTFLALPEGPRLKVTNVLYTVIAEPYGRIEAFWDDVATVREENIELRRRLAAAELRAAQGSERRPDGVSAVPAGVDSLARRYYVPCDVLVRQRGRYATMIKIRAREAVAWVPWLPVVDSDNAYLGRLLSVDGADAWVELLWAPDFALGVAIGGVDGLLGVLRPRDDRLVIEMVGRDEDVRIGEEVVTSGIAEIRKQGEEERQVLTRPGLRVGTIDTTYTSADKIFKDVTVAPAAAFERNETVFVVLPPDWDGR